MVNVDLYSAIITKVSNAVNTVVSGEKPGFQALSKGLVVLLCAEVVRQRVPDHGAVHSEYIYIYLYTSWVVASNNDPAQGLHTLESGPELQSELI